MSIDERENQTKRGFGRDIYLPSFFYTCRRPAVRSAHDAHRGGPNPGRWGADLLAHPCDPPPLSIVGVLQQPRRIKGHLSRDLRRQDGHTAIVVGVGTEDLGRLVHKLRGWHARNLESTRINSHSIHGLIVFNRAGSV